MNILEKEMVVILKHLRDNYGVFEIKAEFEAEGSRMDEMMRLKDVTSAVGLPIIFKIGGVEAVTDIYSALQIGVKGIVAPMAETPFALSKFLAMIDTIVAKDNAEDIDFAFNLETITAYEKMDEMFALPKINLLHSMTIGRVDLTGSMGVGRAGVESSQVFDICRNAFIKARAKGLKCALGGAISTQTIPFIEKLNKEKLVDKFETRKVVFRSDAVKYGEAAFLKAVEFELLWLKSKKRYYSGIQIEDDHRIQMLSARLGKK